MGDQRIEHLIAIVIADIGIVLLAGGFLGKVAQRLGQPRVVGEIAAGIMLGPSLLGLLPGNLSARIFPAAGRPLLSVIAQVGLLLFMFLVGWEFDGRLLKRHRGTAVSVSLSSIVLAFGLGLGLATMLYARHSHVNGHHIGFVSFGLYVGVAMSITAFPVLARILVDHGLQNTTVGAIALASAAVDDVLAWCLLAVVVAIVTASGSADLVRTAVLAVVYVVAMVAAVRPLLRVLVTRWTRERLSRRVIVILSAGVFFSSFATSMIGLHAIFGAFAFGLIVPRGATDAGVSGDILQRTVGRSLHQISRLFMPVFFIVTGLSVDIGSLGGRDLLELLGIMVVACGGKLLGGIIPGKLWRMSWRDTWSLGLLMNTRGLTELVILNVGVGLGVLDATMFTMMVVMALVTTVMTGVLLPRTTPEDGTRGSLSESSAPADTPKLAVRYGPAST